MSVAIFLLPLCLRDADSDYFNFLFLSPQRACNSYLLHEAILNLLKSAGCDAPTGLKLKN